MDIPIVPPNQINDLGQSVPINKPLVMLRLGTWTWAEWPCATNTLYQVDELQGVHAAHARAVLVENWQTVDDGNAAGGKIGGIEEGAMAHAQAVQPTGAGMAKENPNLVFRRHEHSPFTAAASGSAKERCPMGSRPVC